MDKKRKIAINSCHNSSFDVSISDGDIRHRNAILLAEANLTMEVRTRCGIITVEGDLVTIDRPRDIEFEEVEKWEIVRNHYRR